MPSASSCAFAADIRVRGTPSGVGMLDLLSDVTLAAWDPVGLTFWS